jgi:DNA-3-methyladenine glycosylase
MAFSLKPLQRRSLPRDPVALARFLVGKTLVRKVASRRLVGRIVETEAYLADDPASHSFIGQTARNRSMYLARGHAYIYRIYGLYWCLNVSAGDEGEGAAVLLRALEPLGGIDLMQTWRGGASLRDLARGPGRLSAALDVSKDLDGADLCSEGSLWLGGATRPVEIANSVRVGITRATELPLRFFERNSAFVSGRKRLNVQ